MNIRCDALLADVEVSGGGALVVTLADAVDLVVDGGTVVVTVCSQNIQYVFS